MRDEVKNYISFARCRFRRYPHGFRGFACTQFCTQTRCRGFLTGSGGLSPPRGQVVGSKLRMPGKYNLARLPLAHRTRTQRLLLLLLTANVSNKSGNLLFAQSNPQQYENVRFVHSWCTVEVFPQSSCRVRIKPYEGLRTIATVLAELKLKSLKVSGPPTCCWS